MITSQAERHALIDKINQLIQDETNALVRSEDGGEQRRGRIAAYQKIIDLVSPKAARQTVSDPAYGFGGGPAGQSYT